MCALASQVVRGEGEAHDHEEDRHEEKEHAERCEERGLAGLALLLHLVKVMNLRPCASEHVHRFVTRPGKRYRARGRCPSGIPGYSTTMVEAGIFPTRSDAEIAQGALEARHRVGDRSDDAGGAYPFGLTGGARLFVDEADAEDAAAVLAGPPEES